MRCLAGAQVVAWLSSINILSRSWLVIDLRLLSLPFLGWRLTLNWNSNILNWLWLLNNVNHLRLEIVWVDFLSDVFQADVKWLKVVDLVLVGF